MKLSVSLPEEDVQFLDAFASTQRASSRSAVVHRAVRLLRASQLGPDYEDAWRDWTESGEAEVWDSAAGDGLG
ncbi:MAG: ribbon-helix-helix domain-containing protein [Acidimicrobiales bacterium]